jgi:ABC-type sugar transport system ATPase subunit
VSEAPSKPGLSPLGGAAPSSRTPEGEPAFSVENVSKNYGAVRALRDVSISLRAGEVHAIVGQNGSGKSTLVKLLSGTVKPDAGEIKRDGRELKLNGTGDSSDAGISTVFQELSVLPSLSVAENLLVDQMPRSILGTIKRRALETRAREILDRYRMDLPVERSCRRLSLLELQLVEVGRALASEPDLLILDEATSALDQPDAENLLRISRELAEQGKSVLFVSHRLDEVMSVADHVTVLTHGRVVASVPTSETNREELLKHLAGKALKPLQRLAKAETEATPETLLHATLPGFAEGGGDLEVTLHKGEILGLAGLQGHGQKEVLRLLSGDMHRRGFAVELEDGEIKHPSPSRMVRRGIAYVPEDRNTEGLLLGHSIRANSTLSSLGRVTKAGFLSRKAEDELCNEVVEMLSVKMHSPAESIENLSGGNQQKVLIGRSLLTGPKVLLLDDPTRGIDAGAKADIYLTLQKLAESGVGIVFNSTELPELEALADRVLVFHDQELFNELKGDDIIEDRILASMLGAGK